MTSTDTSDGASVVLRGVTKRYGSVTAVDGLDLTLPAGRTIALLGPNGSGKSTTVLMLMDLLRPTSGTIRVCGLSPSHAVRQGLVGAMLQEGGFPNSTRVRDVLTLASRVYRDPTPLDEVVAVADLGDLLDRRVNKLSGGQTQRVRFAFAFTGNPQLLILDEPTVGMDIEARNQFWSAIRRFADRGRTVLFSTHYLEEADEAADEIVVLAKGTLLARGTPAQIKSTLGTRTVSFRLDGAPASGLESLAAVTGIEIRGSRVHLHTSDPDATVTDLFRTRGGAPDLELSDTSLGASYLALTTANPGKAATEKVEAH